MPWYEADFTAGRIAATFSASRMDPESNASGFRLSSSLADSLA
jgi:hypothetical protein